MSQHPRTARAPLFVSEDDLFALRPVLGWTLFSLTAGYVNAGAFMACRNVVTHITGLVTRSAIGAPDETFPFESLILVLAFLVGAILAVLTAETLRTRPRAAFAVPISFVILVLLSIGWAGASAFGSFGASANVGTGAQALPALLAVAMGSLNAAVGAATSNAIRTTHLTGPATDLAGNLVRAALFSGTAGGRELRWALLRATKIVAFGAGGFLAAQHAAHLAYGTFVVGAALLAIATCLTTFVREAATVRHVAVTRSKADAPRGRETDPAGDIAARR
jgi:hypothetical protein